MNKIKSTLFLAIFVAVTATTTLAGDGQIPIMRTALETDKTTATIVVTATEPKSEISSEISDYLWTLISVINEFKF